jgi:hypothetical protein
MLRAFLSTLAWAIRSRVAVIRLLNAQARSNWLRKSPDASMGHESRPDSQCRVRWECGFVIMLLSLP